MFFSRFNHIRNSLRTMLQELSEEEFKHVNTAGMALLLKTIASKFIGKEIYRNGLKIKSYYKESKHLSVLVI